MASLDTHTRENSRITLGLLEAVDAGRAHTQRGLAADLGIALGLVVRSTAAEARARRGIEDSVNTLHLRIVACARALCARQ